MDVALDTLSWSLHVENPIRTAACFYQLPNDFAERLKTETPNNSTAHRCRQPESRPDDSQTFPI